MPVVRVDRHCANLYENLIIRRDWLEAAYEACVYPLDMVTDDLPLLESTNREAWLVPGDEANIKVTTPLDLRIATAMMSVQ